MKGGNEGMKKHNEYSKELIGSSDIASLILVGCGEDELKLKELHFGGDGSYQAYIVTEDIEIPNYYNKVEEFKAWLKIYDDDGLVRTFRADTIKVFRAKEMGCIVQMLL